jgi:hypothetical protein
VPVDPIDDDNPIEDILLSGFPNPERVGCPPQEVIEALGERKIGREDPAWQHIWSCSPCFAIFKAVRDTRLAAAEREYHKLQRRKRALAFAAAALVCAVIIGAFVFSVRRSASPRGFAVIPIDLTDIGTLRGPAEDDGRVLAQLPRKLDELHITLPRLSRQGRYVVALLKSRSETSAIALGSAATSGNDVRATLVVTLDLSAAKPGRYFLGTRLEEQGQETAAYYYPVLISD